MTRSFLTVRAGATVTHVHCKDMAAMWVSHLIAASLNHNDSKSYQNEEHMGPYCADRSPERAGKTTSPLAIPVAERTKGKFAAPLTEDIDIAGGLRCSRVHGSLRLHQRALLKC